MSNWRKWFNARNPLARAETAIPRARERLVGAADGSSDPLEQAEAARAEAIRQRDEAEAARWAAVQQREIAESNRWEAVRQRDEAEAARWEAVKRYEAESARWEAINQRLDELQRSRTEEARQTARHADNAQRQLHRILHVASMAARGQTRRARIRVLFVIHFIESWFGLEAVYRAMAAASDFEPIVVTVDRRMRSAEIVDADDERAHRTLEAAGVPHLRWGGAMTNENEDDYVRLLSPDVIFRQTPWENSFPEPLQTPNIAFSRLCYLPYQMYVGDAPAATVNQAYLFGCWRIFAMNQQVHDYHRQHSRIGNGSVVVTGHPALDCLTELRGSAGVWPIPPDASPTRRLRVLWAPHHSVSDDWLGFGTFVETHRAICDWAAQDVSVEIVLRPHHLTFDRLVTSGAMGAEQVERFRSDWAALSNTAIDDSADYAATFAASDVLLTDGMSFIASYLAMDKPLLFLDSGKHWLSEVGANAARAAYRFETVAQVREFVGAYQASGEDPLRVTRSEVLAELMPYPGQATARVLDEIRAGIAAESGNSRGS